MTEEQYQKIKQKHLSRVNNLDKKNQKLAVFFSGGNAVGKSSLSNFLSEKLDALVLSNDDAREAIEELYPEFDRKQNSDLVWQYTLKLYDELSEITENGLVVRDAVIDWYPDAILKPFVGGGYAFYTIWFSLSDKFNLELIEKRGDKSRIATVDRLKELFVTHKTKQESFRKNNKPDYEVTDNNFGDWQQIADDIRKHVVKLA